MHTTLFVAVLPAILLVSTHPAPPDPCKLLTAAEISAALGKTPSGGKPTTRVDEEAGATMVSCTRQVGDHVFDVSVAEFASASAAEKSMNELAAKVPDDEDEAKLLPTSGIGERALFGASRIGAHWFVKKGRLTLAVTLAGELGNGAQFKDALRKLTEAAFKRL